MAVLILWVWIRFKIYKGVSETDQVVVELTDSAITFESKGVRVGRSWSTIERVIETPQLFILCYKDRGAATFPKRIFTGVEHADVTGFLREKGVAIKSQSG